MRPRAAIRAAFLVILTIGGCTATPSGSPPETEPASSTIETSADECQPIDLRGPDGETVDLTGTYSGAVNGLYIVKQTASCLAMEALSAYPGEPLGYRWRFVFTGVVQSEFSVSGRWMWVYTRSVQDATNDVFDLALQIGFEDDGSPTVSFSSVAMGHEDEFSMTISRINTDTVLPQ